jgi:uncharacterized protein
MRGRLFCSPPLVAGALSLALAGCVGSSRPSRFYTLAPIDVRHAAMATAADATLAVGPVEIPDYVDRHPIVTRAGTNELVVADFDRWAGSLEEEITRSLVAALADRLASRNVAVSTWRSAGFVAAAAPTYRVAVTFSRFDGVLGGSVVLRGRWALLAERDAKASSLLVREATVTEKVDGAGYDALVAAMARALIRFGEEMADSVTAATQVAKVP